MFRVVLLVEDRPTELRVKTCGIKYQFFPGVSKKVANQEYHLNLAN
jgi:hypothetical protein